MLEANRSINRVCCKALDRISPNTAQAINRLEALVVRLGTNWPNAIIIVGSLTEVSEPLNTQIQTTFNTFLPGLCERQRGLGRQVSGILMGAQAAAHQMDQEATELVGNTNIVQSEANLAAHAALGIRQSVAALSKNAGAAADEIAAQMSAMESVNKATALAMDDV